jgi:hypothetical protein
MKWVSNWSRLALLYFVLAAGFGIILRYLQTAYIVGLNYQFILHTHSHVALLGWVYIALTVAIAASSRSIYAARDTKVLRRILWFTNFTVVGMLLSFPVQGYKMVSITFSTLFLVATYWFVWWFLAKSKSGQQTVGDKFIKSGLIYLVISSAGPWALGPIIILGGSHSDWYYLAIYFYLHFLYNGFFVMTILGLVFKLLDQGGVEYKQVKAERAFVYMNLAVVPAFLLSTLWMQPSSILYAIGAIAALAQVVALIYFYPILRKLMQFVVTDFRIKILFYVAFLAFTVKLILQAVSSLPVVADFIYQTNHYTAIGYLHLVLLAFISMFLLGYYTYTRIYVINRITVIGLGLFLLGLGASEILLFGQGLITYILAVSIPDFHKVLLYASSFMPVGLLVYGVGQLFKNRT